MKKNKILAVLICIASIALAIKFNYIVYPNPFNLDWTYSATLIHLDTMDQYDSIKNIIAPTLTYPSGANKFIDSNSTNEPGLKGFVNDEGEYFYMSYPPFAFMLPFLIFKMFHIPIHIVSLKFFSFLVHIVSAFIMYHLLVAITKKQSIGICAFCSFLFFPIVSYWHMWIYFSDMLVHTFFIYGLYLIYKILENKDDSKYVVAYSINLFFMCYTDWLGFIFSGIVFLLLLICKYRSQLKKIIISSVAIPTLAGIAILSQYSYALGGLDIFLKILWGKYVYGYSRGGTSMFVLEKIDTVISHYQGIVGLLIVCTILLLAYYFLNNDSRKLYPNYSLRFVFIVSFLTVLLHHCVFLNWTSHPQHYYSVVKGLVPITILASYTAYIYLYHSHLSTNKIFKFVLMCTALFFYTKSTLYFLNGLPSVPEDYSSSYCDVARQMSSLADADSVIFIKDVAREVHLYPLSTVMPYCAKRNIAVYYNRESAEDLMKKNSTTQGIVFTVQYFGDSVSGFADIVGIEEINLASVE